MAEESNSASLIAAILGAVIFAALLILFGNVLWAAVAGVGGFVAGRLIFTPPKKDPRDFGSFGLTPEELERALAEGRSKIDSIREAAGPIRSGIVKAKIGQIIDVAQRILEDIEHDPKDLRRARQFFSYYLDATIKIVRRYAQLSARGLKTADVTQAMEKTEEILDTLRKAFEKQLALLLEDDVMDLDTELQLLERTIKMEGLADDET